MWRQTKFPGHEDSDQSISEEESETEFFGGNYVSLGGMCTPKEECLQVQSRLEMLRGSDEQRSRKIQDSLRENLKQTTSLSLEVPDSPDECNNSPRLVNNDDSRGSKSARSNEVATWSTITKEAEALILLNGNVLRSSSRSANSKSGEGVKGKFNFKPKFSLNTNLHKETSSKLHANIESLESDDQALADDLIADSPEDFYENSKCLSASVHGEVEGTVGQRSVEHSMTELLDGLQDNNSVMQGKSKTYCRGRGKSLQLAVRRRVTLVRDRNVDSELPESLDSGSSSDNDEAKNEIVELPLTETKRQCITDRFHEALCATTATDAVIVGLPKGPSAGLFGKLQQVMQIEKERDTDFLNNLQSGVCPTSEPTFIDVMILSRYLEAKLIVCQCSISRTLEDIPRPDIPQVISSKTTVIFNPKVSGDVDIEVGKIVRIHAPWREVQMNGSASKIVLSTYFSDISTCIESVELEK